jgi:hypothetical protein
MGRNVFWVIECGKAGLSLAWQRCSHYPKRLLDSAYRAISDIAGRIHIALKLVELSAELDDEIVGQNNSF